MLWFFFSSRRRHSRCGRDWSSDVCSSDLERQGFFQVTPGQGKPLHRHKVQNGRIIFRPAVEPLGPGGQEVQSGTKAGFRNHKMTVIGQLSKTLPEPVAADEYIAGFFQPVVATEVHITKA